MIQIDKAIISLDVIEEYFLCDLMSCKGACCVEGSSGAPLTDDEAIMIELHYPDFENYMTEESKTETEIQGFSVIDRDGDLVTPLLNNKECVYSYIDESGITKCAIEKAYLEGIIPFRKPISCHLFPIRITEYDDFDAVNYQKIPICNSGRICGKENKLPLYKFLKEPLIRKYGEEWYKDLEVAAEHIKSLK
jgi:hypothetical protein